jgi:hypothetical protein
MDGGRCVEWMVDSRMGVLKIENFEEGRGKKRGRLRERERARAGEKGGQRLEREECKRQEASKRIEPSADETNETKQRHPTSGQVQWRV